jgi:hemolysin III
MGEHWAELMVMRDPVAAGSHFAGFLWGLFATAILWRLSQADRSRQLSVACFTVSMCVLYLASALYHALRLPPDQLHFFRMLDHSAIYCLIAGTYTPIFFVLLRGRLRTVFICLMWGMAAAGIIAKWSLPLNYYPLTVGLYLTMGGIGLLPIPAIARETGWGGAFWGLTGAGLHGSGGILDVLGWPRIYPGVFGSHELLHVLVIAGTAAHFVFIMRYVVPHGQPRVLRLRPALATGGAGTERRAA